MIQRTYILDTNVYGELLIEVNSSKIINGIKGDKSTYVYGMDIIEEEIKGSPVDVRFKGRVLKEAVLTIYDVIIDEELKIPPIADYIASEYFRKFDELRKSGKYRGLLNAKVHKYTEKDLRVDFKIIAMASLKGIDVVVSIDTRTILSKISEDTYNLINKANGLRTPKLVKYSDFKKRYIE